MHKSNRPTREVYSIRMTREEREAASLVMNHMKCKSFSECVRQLIFRELRLMETERKLTSW